MEYNTSNDSIEEREIDLFELKKNILKLSELKAAKVVDIIFKYDQRQVHNLDEFSIDFSKLVRNTIIAIQSFIEINFEKEKRMNKLQCRKLEKIAKESKTDKNFVDSTAENEVDVIDLDSTDEESGMIDMDIIDLDPTDDEADTKDTEIIDLDSTDHENSGK